MNKSDGEYSKRVQHKLVQIYENEYDASLLTPAIGSK